MTLYNNEKYTKVISDAEDDLIEAVRNYSRAFKSEAAKNDGIPTIDRIEQMWIKLDEETRDIFVNMISGQIQSFDEKELISSKKASTGKRG